jgi:uncharacterized protein YdaU (DUF1376 family)
MTGSHWYAWFPGDYARDTAHLSMIEDSAHRRLLDAYYSAGKVSANAEILLRVCRAITVEEQAAVRKVASEFFEVRDGYLFHEKVEHELARSRAITEKRRDAGKRGAATTNGKRPANAVALVATNDSANAATDAPAIPHPQYSVAHATDAAASSAPSAMSADPKKRLFDLGVSLLAQAGDTEKSARSFLAKYAHQDEAKLGEVLGHARRQLP